MHFWSNLVRIDLSLHEYASADVAQPGMKWHVGDAQLDEIPLLIKVASCSVVGPHVEAQPFKASLLRTIFGPAYQPRANPAASILVADR